MYHHGIYVHIPFCKARCNYCAFSSCCDYSMQQAYFDKLYAEIAARSDKSVQVSTVYLGGGTPSSVDTHYLNGVFDCLRKYFRLSDSAEISVECNPESVTDELLTCLKRNGVNRLSFGLQSVNDKTLSTVGRIHRYKQFLDALNLAFKHNFANVSADLILGLPETADDFYRSVQTVADLPLTHVSVYALELHEDSPLYNLCRTRFNFDEDELADMYDCAVQTLSQKGFVRYEISNFAKKGFECLHNLNYWDEGRYFAFGASASGFVGDVRYTNPYSIDDYLSTPVGELLVQGDKLSMHEQANEYVMLRLRLSDGVGKAEFCLRYGADFFDFFPNARKLQRQGLLVEDASRITVAPDKIYVVNSLLCDLLTFD